MKKRILGLLALILLAFTVVDMDALAANDYVVDDAGVIPDDDEAKIESKLSDISAKYGTAIAIYTVKDMGSYTNIEAFSDDYFDRTYGSDGAVFVISTTGRDWYISTKGSGIRAFTDAGMIYIFNQMKGDLGNNQYGAAFNTYANLTDDFLNQASKGKPYDAGNLPKGQFPFVKRLGISLVVGFIIALIINLSERSKLTSVAPRNSATNYVVNNSLKLRNSREIFLYRKVDRQAKPESSSGGSSTHTSSSGSRHGGTGGKF